MTSTRPTYAISIDGRPITDLIERKWGKMGSDPFFTLTERAQSAISARGGACADGCAIYLDGGMDAPVVVLTDEQISALNHWAESVEIADDEP